MFKNEPWSPGRKILTLKILEGDLDLTGMTQEAPSKSSGGLAK